MDVIRKLGAKANVPGFQTLSLSEKRIVRSKLSCNGARVEASIAELLRRSNCGGVDPDASRTTEELIKAAGYPVETHRVVTEDGYIIEVQRIPSHGSCSGASRATHARPPVYLQHGVCCSSSVWVLQCKGRSLAYLLHDLGFDVWLGNFRGNRYGRCHTSLDPDGNPDSFWDFSFHEHGVLDVPAIVDHVLQCTGQPDLLYVGHSMGTTAFFVMLSERPEYNNKVRAMVALAPVAYLCEVRSPLVRLSAFMQPQLEAAARLLGIRELLPRHLPFRLVGQILYRHLALAQTMCYNMMFAFIGFSSSQLYMDMLPVLPSQIPDGISLKTLLHFGQNINSKTFRKWDHGASENLKSYDSECPPGYKFSNIKVPVSVFYSEGDWLPAPNDIAALYEHLPNKNGRYKIKDTNFSHMDFLLSTSAKPLVYDDVLEILEEFSDATFLPASSIENAKTH